MHSKLLNVVDEKLVVDANTILRLRNFGARQARVIILSGAQGAGKSTIGTAMTLRVIVFPSDNKHGHTTIGIDVGILEENDETVSIFLDCEGLLKNATHLDQAQLRLVAALPYAHHVHLVESTINQPVIQNLQALSHFIDENRPGQKAQLKVVLRTRRSGPQDETIMSTLQSLFNDFSVEAIEEVLTDEEPSNNDKLLQDLTAVTKWARQSEAHYMCNTLADAFERMIDAAGVPVPIATLCDQLLFPSLRELMDSIVTDHKAQIAALTADPNAQLQPWVEAVHQELLAVIENSGARLSPVGEEQMRNEARRHIEDLESHWRHQVELHRVEAKRREAQDKLDLNNQREEYAKKREETKEVSGIYHPGSWRSGGRTWYGRNHPGSYTCCGSQTPGEGGCANRYSYTLPEWNDTMFVQGTYD